MRHPMERVMEKTRDGFSKKSHPYDLPGAFEDVAIIPCIKGDLLKIDMSVRMPDWRIG